MDWLQGPLLDLWHVSCFSAADLSLTHLVGDIVHVRIWGQSTIVLGSAQVIEEYLEKKSTITSDRHQSPLIEL